MKLLTAILFVIFSYFSEKTVSIKVVDYETHEELIGAKVKINDDVYYTDLYGTVEVKIDQEEKYSISIESETYQTRAYINVSLDDVTFGLKSK